MNKISKVPTEFEPETVFELDPNNGKASHVNRIFNQLRDRLLSEMIEETETLALKPALTQAANEAAGLAWITGFPLLTFPILFAEKAQDYRNRLFRQERITARSSGMLEEAVC
ncbi:MAG: hypothetical protein SFY81_03185 [Verrucomicrobiota bacterium]|nr:hypothetical protein [Verrucomicrobiota bacterium]